MIDKRPNHNKIKKKEKSDKYNEHKEKASQLVKIKEAEGWFHMNSNNQIN